MPSRRSPSASEQWTEAAPPQSAIQRGAYLDLCTRSLVHAPRAAAAEHGFSNDSRTSPPNAPTVASRDAQRVFTYAETLHIKHRMCVICEGTDDVQAVLANPFAIRCYVCVCRVCLSSN